MLFRHYRDGLHIAIMNIVDHNDLLPAKILETERVFYPAVNNFLSARNGSETSNFSAKGLCLILFFIKRG